VVGPDPELGVFETLLVVDGVPIEWEWHRERLAGSTRALYGKDLGKEPAPPAPPALDPGPGRRRVRVTVRPEGRRLVTLVEAAPLGTADEPGLAAPTVALAPVRSHAGLGCHKWRDRRWLEQVASGPGTEPLLIDAGGLVLEAGRANVFLVEAGRLVTPPLDGRILPGVTRRRLCRLASVAEEPITLERLLRADEVFLTGSLRGVEPVLGCQERSWQVGRAAPDLGRRLGLVWRAQVSEASRATG
jgi:para-aminobenzoate synthetase/4-amino-4-deoxychorismate lyase